MRNFSLGVGRRDLMVFAGATVLMFLLTIAWDLFLADVINDQALNKYVLTLVVFGLAALIAFVSSVLGGRPGAQTPVAESSGGARVYAARSGVRGMLPGLLVRFGLALEIFGTIITPIGLWYATNPTRSVPIGFAAFSAVMIGLIIAGIGGNMLVPRRS